MNKKLLLVIGYLFLIKIASSQTQQRILIDIGSPPNKDGVLTSSPDSNGNYWNNVTDVSGGVRLSNAISTKNIVTPVGLQVVNRIDGTYDVSQPGTGNGNTIGAIGDYPASATNDYAFAHESATNGQWKIIGLNSSNTYKIKFWGAKSAIAFRDIQIKRSDESNWQGYSAANNTNYDNAAVFTVSGKTEVAFDIRVLPTSSFGYINVIDITFSATGAQPNQPPVARAGNDTTILSPLDSVRLNGCASYDPEVAPLQYKWRKISGPAMLMPADNTCSIIVKSLLLGTYQFELAVTDTGRITAKDTVSIVVNNILPTPWPVVSAPICSQPYKIVVLGSSTAYGTGTNPIDSSWVNKFRMFVQKQNSQVNVTNLATLGLTSFDVNPTGFVPPPGYRTPDTLRNITKAVSLNPDAIIINLPSNDIALGYTVQEFEDNMNRIVAIAYAKNIPVWVTTTQPRDNLNLGERNSQVVLRDWINQRFGNFSIDFWTDIATADLIINPLYAAGDGIHLNNYGHHILFTRVVYEDIWDTICNRKYGTPVNKPPVAKAGADIIITLPATAPINGTASSDPDGTIAAFKWKYISGPSGSVIAKDTARQTTVSFTTAGQYNFELAVTDNKGAIGKDTIMITVNAAANKPPVAKAGTDITITLPATASINGTASSDSDGTIAAFKWKYISGPSGAVIAKDTARQTTISFTTAGQYKFELAVTDNKGAIGKDTIMITVNAANKPPIANAGLDKTIQLPTNRILLDGRSSSDPDGTISSYNWSLVNGNPGTQILNSAKDTTTVTFTSSGSYTFRLTVTDNKTATATDDVIITVQAALVTKIVRVNIYGGANPYNNSQWNNWNTNSSLTSANFSYEDGTASTVNAVLSKQGKINDNGSAYALTAIVCPPAILRYASQSQVNRTLTIKGLKTTATYSFEFYSSRATTGNKTIYTVGSKSDTVNTDNNINDYAKFDNISSDASGTIIISLKKTGLYQYINGFIIKEQASVGRPLTTDLITELKSSDNFYVYPNPFSNLLKVKLNSSIRGKYKLRLINVSGKVVLYKEGTKKDDSLNEQINTASLQKGMYFLEIISDKNKLVRKVIKVS